MTSYPLNGPAIETDPPINPYAPATHAIAQSIAGEWNHHHWEGHGISVYCAATPETLWLGWVFVVHIDGMLCKRQSPFSAGEWLEFEFQHDKKTSRGRIFRREQVFRRGIHYTITVDGRSVAKGKARIQNKYLGLLTIAMFLAILFITSFIFGGWKN